MSVAPLRIPLPAHCAAQRSKKILLLEDDTDFSETIKYFLESNSYEVVTVRDGVDGVREIMAQEFEAIICDMMMPTLPGDMFYLAVERVRPLLCPRFIFMTGLRGSAKINDFIKKVKGTILSKPFPVDDLLELINFLQMRYQLK